MKSTIALLLAIFLNGCSSEVDKCVEAKVRAWDIEQLQVRKKWEEWKKRTSETSKDTSQGRDLSLELGLVRPPDERTKERVAADARVECLQISKVK